MFKLDVTLKNETGLHARPASMFTKEASSYDADVKVIKGGKEHNAKSIMAILSMGAMKGDVITIVAEGSQEREVVEALKKLVDSNFGE